MAAADQDEDGEIRLDTSKEENRQPNKEIDTLKTKNSTDTLFKEEENKEKQDDFQNNCEEYNVDSIKFFNEKSQFLMKEEERQED